jgi:hypothetical protein
MDKESDQLLAEAQARLSALAKLEPVIKALSYEELNLSVEVFSGLVDQRLTQNNNS